MPNRLHICMVSSGETLIRVRIFPRFKSIFSASFKASATASASSDSSGSSSGVSMSLASTAMASHWLNAFGDNNFVTPLRGAS